MEKSVNRNYWLEFTADKADRFTVGRRDQIICAYDRSGKCIAKAYPADRKHGQMRGFCYSPVTIIA